MNENKHTPEPWRVEIGEQPESIALLCTSGLAHFEIVSDSQLGDIHADARRIVACVNACAGMTTEQLDNICMISGSILGRFGELMYYLGQFEKQRDELLAVAEEVRRSGDTRLASMAIAAISSVKGEQ